MNLECNQYIVCHHICDIARPWYNLFIFGFETLYILKTMRKFHPLGDHTFSKRLVFYRYNLVSGVGGLEDGVR